MWHIAASGKPPHIQHPEMKKPILLLLLIATMLLHGCSDDKEFKIEGSVKGTDAQSITLTYYAEGGLKHETITASAGKFAFKGHSATPTMAILSIAPEGQRIATLVVKDGDKISIEADLADPLLSKVNGNSDSEAIAKWIADNANALKSRRPADINQAVKSYVEANRSRLSATAILSSFYIATGYESAADSLVSLLNADARRSEMIQGFNNVVSDYLGAQNSGPMPFLNLYSTSDSIININPLRHTATLLCFLDTDRQARDSVITHMKALHADNPFRRLAQVEISLADDSASWRQSLGRDTVGWPQTWVRGSVMASPIRKLGIRRIPYFIAADSTGHTIYRGSSIGNARRAIEKTLKK